MKKINKAKQREIYNVFLFKLNDDFDYNLENYSGSICEINSEIKKAYDTYRNSRSVFEQSLAKALKKAVDDGLADSESVEELFDNQGWEL